MLAIAKFNSLGLGPKNIICLAHRDALPKLPQSIGVDVPLGLFLIGTADINLDPIDGEIIRPPYGPKDQSIVQRLRPGFVTALQQHTVCQE